jgi:hypothetical protein
MIVSFDTLQMALIIACTFAIRSIAHAFQIDLINLFFQMEYMSEFSKIQVFPAKDLS